MMNKNIFAPAVLFLLLAPPIFAQTQPTPTQLRDMGTPKPATPTWQNQRDLIVLMDNAQDRVALAHQIMSLSLDTNTNLTTQQRYDGLSIAGHTLWSEGLPEDSLTCFNGAIALNIDDARTADSARMKAQSLLPLNRFTEAVDAYQLCYTISKNMLNRGEFTDMIPLIMIPYIETAHAAGNTTLALQLVDEVLQDYSTYGDDGNEIRAITLDDGARTALDAGMNLRAKNNLTTLLNDFPDYGTEFPGDRINLEMDLLKADGHTLENSDPQAVQRAMELINDQRFFGMPVWAGKISQLTDILDQNQSTDHANKLRLWAVDRLDEKASSLPASDPRALVYQMSIQRAQLTILDRLSDMLTAPIDAATRIAILQRIIDEFTAFDPRTAQKAQQKLNNLQPAP